MQAILGWVFRDARRLIGTTLLILAIVVGVGTLMSRGGGSGTSTAEATSTTTVTASSGVVSTAAPGGTDAAAKFLTTAVTFAGVWAGGRDAASAATWHRAVRALATEDLATGLDTTDPTTLPGGTPTSAAQLTFVSSTSALATVPLSSGTTVLVTVVHTGDSWLVSDVQPDEGD